MPLNRYRLPYQPIYIQSLIQSSIISTGRSKRQQPQSLHSKKHRQANKPTTTTTYYCLLALTDDEMMMWLSFVIITFMLVFILSYIQCPSTASHRYIKRQQIPSHPLMNFWGNSNSINEEAHMWLWSWYLTIPYLTCNRIAVQDLTAYMYLNSYPSPTSTLRFKPPLIKITRRLDSNK